MPFNVNQFIRKVNKQVQPKIEVHVVKPQEPPIVKYEEPKQEIVIPVYVPDSDSESEFSSPPVKRTVSPSFERRITLNPLSDS